MTDVRDQAPAAGAPQATGTTRSTKPAPARRTRKAPAPSGSELPRLKLLFVVVDRKKTDYYEDFLQGFEINLEMTLNAKGTASREMLDLLGLTESDKSVVIATLRADRESAVLAALEEKFAHIRGGKGIAYTVPMSSVIGVAVYRFLANMDRA